MLGHHSKGLRVVILMVWLHYGCPRMIKLEIGLHYGCFGNNKKIYRGGEISDGTSPWEFQKGEASVEALLYGLLHFYELANDWFHKRD